MPKTSSQNTLEQDYTASINKVVEKPKRRGFFRRYFALIMVVLVIVLAATSVYFYKKSVTDPNAVSQSEIKSLVQKVERLVVVPEDETPTIATVSDPAALKDEAFFVGAKQGDKVLIYSNAKKAILYDPILDKVIMIAPLNIDAPKPTTPTTTTPAPKADTKN